MWRSSGFCGGYWLWMYMGWLFLYLYYRIWVLDMEWIASADQVWWIYALFFLYLLFLLLLIFNELRNGNSKKVSFLWILSSFLFPVVPFFYVIRVIVRKMKHDSCWLAQDNKEYPCTLRKDALFLKSDDEEVCYVVGWREDTLSLASKDMTLLLTRQWPYNAKQARFNR